MTKIQRGPIARTAGALDKIISGTMTATVTAAAPGRREPILEILIQNDPASANNILVGNSHRQDVIVVPGNSITVPINDLSAVFIRSVAGTSTVNWLAMA